MRRRRRFSSWSVGSWATAAWTLGLVGLGGNDANHGSATRPGTAQAGFALAALRVGGVATAAPAPLDAHSADVPLAGPATRPAGSPTLAREAIAAPALDGIEWGALSDAGWQFIPPAVRRRIDRAVVPEGRWREIVVCGSGSDSGDAATLDFLRRRVSGDVDGLAGHFVIGNGSYSPAGQVEVGSRWDRQTSAPAHPNLPTDALCITVIGEFESNSASEPQCRALRELVNYLHSRIGFLPVRPLTSPLPQALPLNKLSLLNARHSSGRAPEP